MANARSQLIESVGNKRQAENVDMTSINAAVFSLCCDIGVAKARGEDTSELDIALTTLLREHNETWNRILELQILHAKACELNAYNTHDKFMSKIKKELEEFEEQEKLRYEKELQEAEDD